jgi:hypothetical protein
MFFDSHDLGVPDSDTPLKIDDREHPVIDSLKVSLFIYPKQNLMPDSNCVNNSSTFLNSNALATFPKFSGLNILAKTRRLTIPIPRAGKRINRLQREPLKYFVYDMRH